MRNRFIEILDATYPFILALLIATLTFAVVPAQAFIPLPGGGSVTLLQDVMNLRILFLLVVLFFLLFPIFRNYERFVPKKMNLKVCFDTEGIVAALRSFSETELKELRIEEGWREKQYNLLYYDKLTAVARQLHLPEYAKVNEKTSTKGNITIIVRKLRGWQRYQIKELFGSMYYRFSDERGNTAMLKKELELMPTDANVISFTFTDLFIHRSKVIQPRFIHYVPRGSGSRFHVEDMIVIAISKLSPFSVPIFGKTIYCVEDTFLLNKQNDKPKLIPVAYGVYNPM
jgi:hypothetical protein